MAARNTTRPILPKPLIPIFMLMLPSFKVAYKVDSPLIGERHEQLPSFVSLQYSTCHGDALFAEASILAASSVSG